MSYILKEQLAASGNYGGNRSPDAIQYLVIHYTGNNGDTAANNAAYFQNNIVKSSAHYFVDDTTVYQSVPDLKIAWAVGGKPYSDIHKTGGATMYGIITNRNSINVELCDTIRDGIYLASEATLANAVRLCRKLMAQYQIPVSRIYRHFDVTGKHCPSYFLDDDAWNQFKNRLGENAITQKEFDQFMENWLQRQATQPAASVSEEARHWAENHGIVSGFADGSKQYKSFCTREQVVLMLYRFLKLLQN